MDGLYVCGYLSNLIQFRRVSGFGVMCSQAAGSLVAGQVLSQFDSRYEKTIPMFAKYFDPNRFKGTQFGENAARYANQL